MKLKGVKGRFYGGNGTIHSTDHIDVETDNHGDVVAVWFRCQLVKFKQHDVDDNRAASMRGAYQGYEEDFALEGLVMKET